ncbi:NTF2-like protein [Pluteus cervinus]|uniref:NTF2-like protein n=1 Tax=Pluteus cervinus TaxID=181527 RepID=A0ACD3BHR7_9AGAR|nr:NTF2-like protein [Pluteus cervinus]
MSSQPSQPLPQPTTSAAPVLIAATNQAAAPVATFSAEVASTQPRAPLTSNDIEIATRAADQFQRLYYNTYDSKTRLSELPKLYRPTSSLTWNGKPYQGVDGVQDLISQMPVSKHEVQSFDCHPIPGTSPPSLLVTVSGNVVHGRPNPNQAKKRAIDEQPRVFHQTFMLVPDSAAPPTKAGEVGKYYISADAFRFVG